MIEVKSASKVWQTTVSEVFAAMNTLDVLCTTERSLCLTKVQLWTLQSSVELQCLIFSIRATISDQRSGQHIYMKAVLAPSIELNPNEHHACPYLNWTNVRANS